MSNVLSKIISKTSTIADGNMSFRFGRKTKVVENRRKFLDKCGIKYENCVCMACDHGTTISPIDWSNSGAYLGARTQATMLPSEVLVTQEKGLTLMLLTADCLPTSFYDPVTKTIALAHFSRATIAKMLPQKTVGFLWQHYNVKPNNLRVYVGPHITKSSYKFPSPLTQVKPAIKPFLSKIGNFTQIDLLKAQNYQLIVAGIPKENIKVSKIDTATSPSYFSYFRSQQNNIADGRMATIVMLKNPVI